MSKLYTTRTALALAAAALLAACGGGESPRTAAQTFTDALEAAPAAPTASSRVHALSVGIVSASAAAGPITNDQLFRGAEAIYPALFPSSPAPTAINDLPYQGRVYQVRAYANGNYLGIANDGTLWGLGPFTGGALTPFGTVQSYADQVCAAINCGGGGDPGGGNGPLNGCTMPASEALRTGNRYSAVYVSNLLIAPTSSGEYTITGQVDGPATFESQAVIKVTSTVKGVEQGQSVDTTDFAYMQIAENDHTRIIGNETATTFSGISATIKTVFSPPDVDTEFALAIGQTLSKTVAGTTTTVAPGLPVSLPPTNFSSTTTYTYEARESISVLGRSYDTCRYKTVGDSGSASVGFTWYIVGQGLPARLETRAADGTVQYRAELKSATINGTAL